MKTAPNSKHVDLWRSDAPEDDLPSGPTWKSWMIGAILVIVAIEVLILFTHSEHHEHQLGSSHLVEHAADTVIGGILFAAVIMPILWIFVVRPYTEASRIARERDREIRLSLEEGHRIGRLGYWSADATTGRFTWSRECYDMVEIDPNSKEDPDDIYVKRVHPDDLALLEQEYERVLREGGEYDIVHRVSLPGGRVKWMRERAEAVLAPSGDVIGVRGILQDQTDTMALEEALRDNHERFRATFEQAAVGMAHVALDGEWLRMNRKLREMLGYEEGELRGTRFQDITHPEDVAKDRENMRAAMAGEISEYRRKKRYIRKDGSIVWVQLTVSMARNADGGPGYFILVAEEMDARLRAERALAERTAQLESVLESADQGIGMVDAEGRIFALNPAFFRLYALDPEEFGPGTRLIDLHRRMAERGDYGPGDPEELAVQATKRIRADGPVRFTRTLPNGREVEVNVNSDAGGGRVTTFTDITERRRMERDLSEALRVAEEANRAKSDFLATMSHELRTPLNAILGFAEILSHQYFGPIGQSRYIEYAEDIETSGRYLLELINDVLDISKIEAGEYMLSPAPLSVAAVIDDCVTLMSHRADIERIAVHQSVDQDLPEVIADRRALKQMLLNLLSNALKFTLAGGAVRVSARLKGGHHEITVSDTGPGIEAEEIPFLLEPFKKGRENPDISVEGAGLGLAITNSLARLHSGSVEGNSVRGQGTAVTIRLPMRTVREVEAPPREPAVESV